MPVEPNRREGGPSERAAVPHGAGTFARRTGQAVREAQSRVVVTLGAVLMLLDGLSRSPWAAWLAISKDVGLVSGMMGAPVMLVGFAWRWSRIRCPKCGAAVHWRHVTTQPMFRKDLSDPDRYGCPSCGYNPV
jgi:predicted RNA-binding Zn-ribbon protein involved in translation (DUF1610 family)